MEPWHKRVFVLRLYSRRTCEFQSLRREVLCGSLFARLKRCLPRRRSLYFIVGNTHFSLFLPSWKDVSLSIHMFNGFLRVYRLTNLKLTIYTLVNQVALFGDVIKLNSMYSNIPKFIKQRVSRNPCSHDTKLFCSRARLTSRSKFYKILQYFVITYKGKSVKKKKNIYNWTPVLYTWN